MRQRPRPPVLLGRLAARTADLPVHPRRAVRAALTAHPRPAHPAVRAPSAVRPVRVSALPAALVAQALLLAPVVPAARGTRVASARFRAPAASDPAPAVLLGLAVPVDLADPVVLVGRVVLVMAPVLVGPALLVRTAPARVVLAVLADSVPVARALPVVRRFRSTPAVRVAPVDLEVLEVLVDLAGTARSPGRVAIPIPVTGR